MRTTRRSEFKARARRNKLLGLWAAQKLGLAGDAAEAYAKEIVTVDFEEPGDDDVFAQIRADFDAKAVAQSDHQIRRTMDELMAKAVEDVKAGPLIAADGETLARTGPCRAVMRAPPRRIASCGTCRSGEYRRGIFA